MKTSILQLEATGPDPTATQRYLQALIDEYLKYKKETRRLTAEEVFTSLTEQSDKREGELKAEQDKWVEFQKTNNLAVLEEEGKSAGLYLADLNLQRAKLELERQLIEKGVSAREGSVTTNVMGAAKQPENNANPNTFFTPLDQTLKSARVELAVLQAERAGKTNQSALTLSVRRLDEDIARLKKTIAALEKENLSQRRLELNELEERIAAVNQSIPEWEGKVLNLNDRLSQSQRFKNEIQRLQASHDHLLLMLQSVDLTKSVAQEQLAVLQVATPAQTEKRNLPLRIVLAIVGGLCVSLGLAFAWYLLDDRFVSVRDIKDQFGETVLGLVPQVRIPRAKPEAALLEPMDSRHAYTESYRHLRSALLLSTLSGQGRPQTILLTGVDPAEGKTTIAVNLARVLARSGLRVALVDADIHAGRIHRLFGGDSQPGVLDFLRGDAELATILRTSDVPGMTWVSIGTSPDNCDGLFLRPRLTTLLQELRLDRDFVIFDGAPVLGADEAALLAPHADSIILVVRPLYTRSRLLRQALDMLYQRQAKHVAIILNRARKDDLAGHYSRNGVAAASRNGT